MILLSSVLSLEAKNVHTHSVCHNTLLYRIIHSETLFHGPVKKAMQKSSCVLRLGKYSLKIMCNILWISKLQNNVFCDHPYLECWEKHLLSNPEEPQAMAWGKWLNKWDSGGRSTEWRHWLTAVGPYINLSTNPSMQSEPTTGKCHTSRPPSSLLSFKTLPPKNI